MPKISVIVPVYKAEKYLNECVESVLKQTFKDFELILVDDGSPDSSGKICDKYAIRDNRVQVIHQKNSGVAVARNSGLEIARGEYVIFMDSDDYIDSDMYESMIKITEKYNCDLVICDCIKEFENYRELYTHDIREGFYNESQLKKEYYPHLLIMPNIEYPATISNWVCLFRRECYKCLRYEAGIRFSEDWLFGAQLAVYARSFYYMKNKPYYHYRMNESSVTHTFTPDKWKDYQKLYSRIKENFSNRKDFDFSKQMDLVLLFLVLNSVGDLLGAKDFSIRIRKRKIKNILKNLNVREMFKRIKISQLDTTKKMKIIIWFYKYNIGIFLLCWYYGK